MLSPNLVASEGLELQPKDYNSIADCRSFRELDSKPFRNYPEFAARKAFTGVVCMEFAERNAATFLPE
jgi:hypothetical protein